MTKISNKTLSSSVHNDTNNNNNNINQDIGDSVSFMSLCKIYHGAISVGGGGHSCVVHAIP